MHELNTIAVIGAGDMGHGIAESALIAGFDVYLYDIAQEFLDRGTNGITTSLAKFASKGIVSRELHDRILNHLLHATIDLEEAVGGADLVIEAIPEDLSLKTRMFGDLDRLAPPHAILASNSSTIPITTIASGTDRPDRTLGLHYFNPVVLMKLVEVIKGDGTSDQTMKAAHDFVLRNQKIPIRVNKDVPGFIVNRSQAPGGVLLHCILDRHLAEPEEVDALFRSQGSPMGPYETMDYTGIDVNYHFMKYLGELVHPDYTPGAVVSDKVSKGELGKKTGRGLFDWTNGRPDIDLTRATDVIDPMDFIAVNANEAVRIVEMGVCSAGDVDVAIINATGVDQGLLETAAKLGLDGLIGRLNTLAERFGKETFKPAACIERILFPSRGRTCRK